MKQNEKEEVEELISKRINLVERVVLLEEKIKNLERFKNAVIGIVATALVSGILLRLMQVYLGI